MRRNLWWMMGPLREGEPEGGGGGAFDPVKFRAEIMGEVTKNLNGGISRLERQLAALKPATPPAGDDDGGDPPPDPKGGKVDPEIAKLRKLVEKNNAELAAEREARTKLAAESAEKERQGMIRQEIAKAGLAEHAFDDAFRFFRDEVKRNDSGELVGPDDVPLSDFVKATVEKRTHWLPPRQVNGTGATGGSARGGKAPDLSDIRPGMKAEEKRAIYARIAELTGARNQ